MSLLIHTQQKWLPRLIDGLLTLLAWVGLAYLIYRGVLALLHNSHMGLRLSFGLEILQTLSTLTAYAVVALAIGLCLFAWAKYNERRAGNYQRRERVPDVGVQSLSDEFQVSLTAFAYLQCQQVLVLHHHDHGSLSAIELPGTGLLLPAMTETDMFEQICHNLEGEAKLPVT
ncbi:poly-beta-1,6-N-acetyl-D-glucosamine biosynthesis protein PgaD [Pseudomonas sp. 5P_3.1_Bac2]|uniref:poly-beta-1,6-N-acetyl-D-glucosamine biosynthesis protein PgaD n=1 Tax=Pseudomonas sp. 5P_3.1_Bac2 TaxID=2971617 RepID=UPI0021C71DD1|nr:poly-beta-1,6-N-acetyl-D-glucosamine biosynthesis protein PgaD [Pseudomonas sp. 5P_3.1_Bac2]MCU1717781.1 poly-beta-1,6-N-acetyl-D-glucosamine biosynthesis protein PgaD [Pseudomonas sp. 5P_3.1_Bac2]